MDETSWGATGQAPLAAPVGGRFDFDDGGTYLGGWEDGKAHGHGVCTGPKGQGAYAGSWHYGFEVSGLYTWPSGSAYEGQWQNGKRHGLGLESRGRWLYRGEWTQGFKGRYGVRQSSTSSAKYEGTWANGLQDGYGSETYADGGTYQGQWLRGMRHGYGVRTSAPFGMASHAARAARRGSVSSQRSTEHQAEAERDRRLDDSRGGFVLKARSDDVPVRRGSLIEKSSNIKKSIFSGLKIRKPRSTGDLEKKGTSGGSIRSTGSSASWVSTESSHSALTSGSLHTDSNASFLVEDEHLDPSATETYMGEWKNDKRSGFGLSERSDGLKYEGEWFNNKKYGYGVTTLRDGTREEGKYKNNLLVTSHKKRHLFLIRSSKFRERIDAAVNAAQRASKIALQKADIAISRTATARGKAEVADMAADQAREDFEMARTTALKFAPDFTLPGLEKLRSREMRARHEEVKAQQQNLFQHQGGAGSAVNSVPGSAVNSLEPSLPGTPARYQNVYDGPTSSSTSYNKPAVSSSPYSPPPQQYQPQPSPYQNQQASYPSQQTAFQHQQTAFQQSSTSYQNAQTTSMDKSMQDGHPTPPEHKTSPNPPASSFDDRTTVRRTSRQLPSESPAYNFQQAMSDHFDHYKRPPSRDSSVDRYTRAASRLGGSSRQPSVEKTSLQGDIVEPTPTAVVPPPQPRSRAPSIGRSPTPSLAGTRGSTPTPVRGPTAGNGAAVGAGAAPFSPPPPFEEVLLRKRGLGQDILPSPVQPKRTESLYVSPQKTPISRPVPVTVKLERKKSLPDVQAVGGGAMSREETSALSSARREEMRKNQEMSEKYRANPLLYLFSPQVKEWFSRQQLVMFVLFVNISLAIMFFKLLT